jgi:hypothetical protein
VLCEQLLALDCRLVLYAHLAAPLVSHDGVPDLLPRLERRRTLELLVERA